MAKRGTSTHTTTVKNVGPATCDSRPYYIVKCTCGFSAQGGRVQARASHIAVQHKKKNR